MGLQAPLESRKRPMKRPPLYDSETASPPPPPPPPKRVKPVETEMKEVLKRHQLISSSTIQLLTFSWDTPLSDKASSWSRVWLDNVDEPPPSLGEGYDVLGAKLKGGFYTPTEEGDDVVGGYLTDLEVTLPESCFGKYNFYIPPDPSVLNLSPLELDASLEGWSRSLSPLPPPPPPPPPPSNLVTELTTLDYSQYSPNHEPDYPPSESEGSEMSVEWGETTAILLPEEDKGDEGRFECTQGQESDTDYSVVQTPPRTIRSHSPVWCSQEGDTDYSVVQTPPRTTTLAGLLREQHTSSHGDRTPSSRTPARHPNILSVSQSALSHSPRRLITPPLDLVGERRPRERTPSQESQILESLPKLNDAISFHHPGERVYSPKPAYTDPRYSKSKSPSTSPLRAMPAYRDPRLRSPGRSRCSSPAAGARPLYLDISPAKSLASQHTDSPAKSMVSQHVDSPAKSMVSQHANSPAKSLASHPVTADTDTEIYYDPTLESESDISDPLMEKSLQDTSPTDQGVTMSQTLDGLPMTQTHTIDGLPMTQTHTIDGLPMTQTQGSPYKLSERMERECSLGLDDSVHSEMGEEAPKNRSPENLAAAAASCTGGLVQAADDKADPEITFRDHVEIPQDFEYDELTPEQRTLFSDDSRSGGEGNIVEEIDELEPEEEEEEMQMEDSQLANSSQLSCTESTQTGQITRKLYWRRSRLTLPDIGQRRYTSLNAEVMEKCAAMGVSHLPNNGTKRPSTMPLSISARIQGLPKVRKFGVSISSLSKPPAALGTRGKGWFGVPVRQLNQVHNPRNLRREEMLLDSYCECWVNRPYHDTNCQTNYDQLVQLLLELHSLSKDDYPVIKKSLTKFATRRDRARPEQNYVRLSALIKKYKARL